MSALFETSPNVMVPSIRVFFPERLFPGKSQAFVVDTYKRQEWTSLFLKQPLLFSRLKGILLVPVLLLFAQTAVCRPSKPLALPEMGKEKGNTQQFSRQMLS